jgi:hypothetical protein
MLRLLKTKITFEINPKKPDPGMSSLVIANVVKLMAASNCSTSKSRTYSPSQARVRCYMFCLTGQSLGGSKFDKICDAMLVFCRGIEAIDFPF